MPNTLYTPVVQIQMEWIARLPASQEAERLLTLPEIGLAGRDPSLPALLSLLQWALEEMPGPGKSLAWATWENLMQLDMMGRPKAAILALLQVDNPEQEVPEELRLASTAAEAAAGILALASDSFLHRTHPWPDNPNRSIQQPRLHG